MLPKIQSGLSVNRSSQEDRELSAVMTLATGATASEDIEIRTMNGREYTVVPVVAIVEGVLHGANASAPEFAAASEFGKFPKAWDGRPVVMNHPQLNGVFVSASIPEVLEDYGMGMIFNSRVEDSKLKCEAWLDHERIESLGEDSELFTTLERIRNKEVVEVSVGAWIDSVAQPGTFNGKKYKKAWKNVAPDHLAFLSEGVKGACSVEDGCGVPRLFSVNAAAIGAASACCESCAEGGEVADTMLELQHKAESHDALVSLLMDTEHTFEGLAVEAIPPDMDMRDIRTIVYQGMIELFNIPPYDIDLVALTANAAVYHIYGKPGLWMREYTVAEDANITFAGEDVPVNLLTRILPRQTTEPTVQHTQENEMSEATSGGQSTNNDTGAAGGSAPAVETTTETTPKQPTLEELLAAASPEMRESIESGIAANAARRDELVKGLLACERCKYTEDQLRDAKRFSLNDLSNMAELAQVANFSGRAVPDESSLSNNSSPLSTNVKAPSNYLGAKADTE